MMTLAEVWQFVADNLTTVEGLVGIMAVIGTGILTVLKVFHKRGEKPQGTTPALTHSGSGDNVAGDKIINTRDPQDQDTNSSLNAAVKRYEYLLKAKETDVQQLKKQIKELCRAATYPKNRPRGQRIGQRGADPAGHIYRHP